MLFNSSKQHRMSGRLLPCLMLFIAALSSSGFTVMAKRMEINSRLTKPLYVAVSSGGSFDSEDGVDKKRRKLIPSLTGWYSNLLDTHEVATKSVSTGILTVVGDICAQVLGEYLKHGNILATSLDKLRMLAFFFDGTFCTGPLLHYVYKLYEHVYPINGGGDGKSNPDSLKRAFVHVLFDNFVMIGAYISLMMLSTALVEGRYKSIPHEFKYDLVPNIKASYKASALGLMWLQLISFYWLPTNLRVLAVNFIDIIWVVVMSFVTHLHRH